MSVEPMRLAALTIEKTADQLEIRTQGRSFGHREAPADNQRDGVARPPTHQIGSSRAWANASCKPQRPAL